MKKGKKLLVFVSLLLTVMGNAYTQLNQQAQDSLLNVMSTQVCFEISKNPASTANEMKADLMKAMMPVVLEHQQQLEQLFGVDVNTPQSFEKFGATFGSNLMINCKTFRDVMMQERNLNETKVDKVEAPKVVQQLSGKLLRVNLLEMNSIDVLDQNGLTHTIWCTVHFSGDDKLVDLNNVGKTILVEYLTESVYDFKTGTSREIKVAWNINGLP